MSQYVIDRKELKKGYNLGIYSYENANLNSGFTESDDTNITLLKIILENFKEANSHEYDRTI